MAADPEIVKTISGIAVSSVVSDNRFVQFALTSGIAAVNRLPMPLRPHVLRATRRARPSRRASAGTAVTRETAGGVPITWLARQPDDAVIVYLHGGAYLAGPVSPQWKWFAEIHR
jgi:acetyl esterase/lipase